MNILPAWSGPRQSGAGQWRLLVMLSIAGLLACNAETPGAGDAPGKDSLAGKNTPAAQPSGTAPSGSTPSGTTPSGVPTRMGLDTLLPTPLAPAPARLSADSVPLRAPDGRPARYGLASGKIVQRYTGNSRGERVTIFDSYGLRERREESTVPYPETARGARNNIIFINTTEEMAYADVRTKMGWKGPNEGYKKYLASDASRTMSLAEYVRRQANAQELPDTTIAGYHCRVLRKQVNGMTVTNWIWRGIVIREHLVSPRDSVEYMLEPVEITANIAVPDSTFRFPAGYRIELYKGEPSKPGGTPPGKP